MFEKLLEKHKFTVSDEHRNALIAEGTEIEPDKQESIVALFEAAVNQKVPDIFSEAAPEAQEFIDTQLDEQFEKLMEKVSGYAEDVVNEWSEDNKVEIDNSIQNKINSNVVEKLLDLVNENYAVVVEEQLDVVNGLTTEIEQIEEKNDKLIDENIELKKQLLESQREFVIKQLTEGYSDSQKDKLSQLLENVSSNNIEDFTKKAEMIVEFNQSKANEVTPTEESSDEVTQESSEGGSKGGKDATQFLMEQANL